MYGDRWNNRLSSQINSFHRHHLLRTETATAETSILIPVIGVGLQWNGAIIGYSLIESVQTGRLVGWLLSNASKYTNYSMMRYCDCDGFRRCANEWSKNKSPRKLDYYPIVTLQNTNTRAVVRHFTENKSFDVRSTKALKQNAVSCRVARILFLVHEQWHRLYPRPTHMSGLLLIRAMEGMNYVNEATYMHNPSCRASPQKCIVFAIYAVCILCFVNLFVAFTDSPLRHPLVDI